MDRLDFRLRYLPGGLPVEQKGKTPQRKGFSAPVRDYLVLEIQLGKPDTRSFREVFQKISAEKNRIRGD